MTSSRILVCILTYNSVRTVEATIAALQQQTFRDIELIVIDNGSTDGTVASLRERHPTIEVVTCAENRGFAGGVNLAIEECCKRGRRHLVVANHDIDVERDAIAHLVETAERYADAGAVGGIETYVADGSPRTVGAAGFSLWRARVRWIARMAASGDEPALRVAYPQGALLLITKAAIDAGVRLDEQLFMYYEEADLGYALAARGLAAYADRRVRVRHDNLDNFLDPARGYWQQRNRLYLVRKHGGWYHALFYTLYATLIEIPMKFVIRSAQGHFRFARACAAGHQDALRGRMGRGRAFELR